MQLQLKIGSTEKPACYFMAEKKCILLCTCDTISTIQYRSTNYTHKSRSCKTISASGNSSCLDNGILGILSMLLVDKFCKVTQRKGYKPIAWVMFAWIFYVMNYKKHYWYKLWTLQFSCYSSSFPLYLDTAGPCIMVKAIEVTMTLYTKPVYKQ